MKSFLKLLLPLLFFSSAVKAQGGVPFSTIEKDFSVFLKTSEGFVSYPFSNSSEFFKGSALIFLGTAALTFADNNVRDFANSNHSDFNNTIFSVDKYYGNLYTAGFSVAIYSYGLLSNKKMIRTVGLKAMTSVFLAGVTSTLIKSVVGRHRPYLEQGNSSFSPFSLDNDFLSFPSGHATVSFAFATVMANSFDNIPWKIFWYGLAATTSLARLYHDQHWVSDVFFGASLGYFTGKFVSNFSERQDSPLLLYITPREIGLKVKI